MIDPELFVIIFVVTIGIFQFVSTIRNLIKRDGKIVVNEAADSMTFVITTDPEEIKKKKRITLVVERH
ncbi:hypothetical protein [Butyrivibrio sp. INlla21]|uniref:hypothetical protein n=1 Tax=Butyrivibrio sp. INlla21 TaxID=1520811 RepID=UPI0008E116DC|nr:hypothetical protein [Butyrivibrio sp. INlla21]SFU33815.1 hypothetical protein SAMN02910342_00139 [Butyrivibrio sp. INlla21]